MFGFPISRKRWPIALDIGAESVKMLQLFETAGRVGIRACGRWRYPDSGESQDQRKEQVVGAIREMLQNQPFQGNKVVSCLSSAQLSVKNVRLSRMPSDELAEAVKWEAKERFGFETDSDQLNFINAGQVRQGSETRDEVIMLAAPRETIDEHLDLVDKAGLIPEAIEAEPVTLFRPFERFLRRHADEQEVNVVIDIGYSATRVTIARGREIVFIKCIDIGGRKLTDAVATQLNLTYREACELRMRNMQESEGPSGSVPLLQKEERPERDRSNIDWTIHDAVRGEVEALAREISLCLRYCSVTFRGLRPKKVILVGGETYDRLMVELLARQLNLPCEVGQPMMGIDTSGVDLGADRRATLAEWTLCMGLATRGADFSKTVQESNHERRRLSA